MVLRCDVLAAAIDAAAEPGDTRPRLLMSPRGRPLTQARVRALAEGPGALIVCGRFEGVPTRQDGPIVGELGCGRLGIGGECAQVGGDLRR